MYFALYKYLSYVMLCYVIKWSHFLFTDMNRADNQKTKAVTAIKFSSTFQTLWLKFQVMIAAMFVNLSVSFSRLRASSPCIWGNVRIYACAAPCGFAARFRVLSRLVWLAIIGA